MAMRSPDVIVVGAGPNGLTAAAVLARAGLEVLVLEAGATIGGSARTEELTLPGFRHDVCSAIHPLGAASPAFAELELERHGLRWLHPELPLAHPLEDGRTAVLHRSLAATAAALGPDGPVWSDLFEPLVSDAETLVDRLLGPLRRPTPLRSMARFGRAAVRSACSLSRRFADEPARALLAGSAGHAAIPLSSPGSASFALVLTLAGHHAGWPCAEGGSDAVVRALAGCLEAHGGRIETGREVRSLVELQPARAVVLDLTPRQVLAVAGEHLSRPYRWWLERYRYGPAAFKVDWALAGPIPWSHEPCRRAGTVHVGGSLEEIAASEAAVCSGRQPQRPFVLVAQQSLFDRSRAPAGRHTAWAYCHVPAGSTADVTPLVEAQIERFAPGFRDLVLARRSMAPADLERHNPNLVGGDIAGGSNRLGQLILRPVPRLDPYSTPLPFLFLCSASTPPGGGVHGMCGLHAAHSVLARRFPDLAAAQSQ